MLNINLTEREQDKLSANTCHRIILQQSEVQPACERCNPRQILNALLTGPIQIVLGKFLQLLGCEQTSKFVQLFLETLNFESNFSDLAEMSFSLIPIIFYKHLLEQVCCNLLAQSGQAYS